MTIPAISELELDSPKNAWIKNLPICPLCGARMMDYITTSTADGKTVLMRACTKHHNDKDAKYQELVAAIADAVSAQE